MAEEYTLIYFKDSNCGNCKRFDDRGIFPQLESNIAKDKQNYPINTAIIDFNPHPKNKALIEKNEENNGKYSEELQKFIEKFKGVPSLVLFYKKGFSKKSDSGIPSGSFLSPKTSSPVLKYFPISSGDSDYLTPEVILADIKDKIGTIKDKGLEKKYLKYKYKYLELRNKYLQQK
jgi:hypothetical protein